MPTRYIQLRNEIFYHIYNKVAEGLHLFLSPADYIAYLKLWKEIDFTTCCRLFAYCLMPTHYHYLLQIIDSKLFPQKISYFFNTYLTNYRLKYNLTGPFFPERYKNIEILNDRYLIGLCYYIHRNPLKAGIVKTLDDWPYSNYLEFVQKRNGTLFDRELYQQYIGSPDEYEKFINEKYDENELRNFID